VAIATGCFPQVSGLVLTFHCEGTAPVVDGIWKAPQGPGGPLLPVGPTDTVRLVVNDFNATGGDGYSVLLEGTDIQTPHNALVDIVVDHVDAASEPPAPGVDAIVEGRIVRN
jgi:hypothetical protein